MADNENFLEKYVGEGKKYATVEDLAKAYDHANKHIEDMNDDNKHLREEFDMFRELTTAQLSKVNTDNRGKETPKPDEDHGGKKPEQPNPAPAAPNGDEGKEVDLDARIAKVLEEKDELKRLNANAAIAEEVMVKHFGSKEKAQEAIRNKAQELGVSAKWLASTAFQSPRAFFISMGVNPEEAPRSTNTPGASSDVNVQKLKEFNPGIRPNSYAFYQEIRKKDPRKYFSNEMQTQIMNEALRQGPDFYN
jgi:hypothetical protein